TLLAQEFDADRLEVRGQTFAVAEHVGRTSAFMSAVSAARNGTIAYAEATFQRGRLMWIDRGGNALGPAGVRDGDYADFRLTPDEKQLAASLIDSKTATEVWLTDLVRSSTIRFASGG